MSKIRWAVIALGLILTGAATGTSSDAPKGVTVDPEVLRLREAAWRAWFAGDEAELRRMLPPEFIGINMQAGPFSTREKTLEQSRAFRAAGGRLVRLEFPETQTQRYGDVVVLYGRYVAVIESDGSERTLSGRLTEVFVRQNGRWLHPGWHLDTVAVP
jgi:ketosteroid isomerase-like protein